VSAEAAASFVSDGAGPWVEDDLGKFDCSIRKPWCEYEVWLCRKFGAPRAVLELMTANIETHGSTAHGWRYKCEGTRKSGDPYTSLMNSIINGLSHLYLYCKWTGKTVMQARKSIRMLVQGDDNCLRHSEWIEFPWQQGMAGLGFDSEALYRKHLFEVEFCSCRLYETDQGVVFGPKPGRVLAKFGYIINPPAAVSGKSMMRGIALGLVKMSEFIPPLRAMVDRTLEITEGHAAWFARKTFTPFDESLKMRRRHTAGVEVMLNLNQQYQWDYSDEKRFEKCLSEMEFGDKFPDIATKLFDRDTGGPQSIFGGGWSRPEPSVAGA